MTHALFPGLVGLGLLLSAGSGRGQETDTKSRPATLAEIRDAVDWTKIPRPDGALPGRNGLSLCSFDAPGTFLEAASFFRKNLSTLGWREDPAPDPGVDQKDYLYLSFAKGDTYFSVNGYRRAPEALMTITLLNRGNVDLRQIAKPGDAKFRNNSPQVALYTTGAAPQDAADFCRKAIVNRGWKETPADSAKFFAKEGRIVLRFVQNAMEIGVVASKNMTGDTEVTLTTGVRNKFDAPDVRAVLTPKEVPAPATIDDYLSVIDLRKFPLMKDATKRERQTEPLAVSNAIAYQAPGTLQDAILHHRKHLLEQGWKETRADTQIEDRAALDYEKQGYLLTVEAGQRKKEPVQISVVNHGNVDLRQLPYPPGTEIAPERDTIMNCTTPVSENDALEFYRKELAALGWHEVKVRGRGSYQFFKHATLLRIEIQQDIEGRTGLNIRSDLLSAR